MTGALKYSGNPTWISGRGRAILTLDLGLGWEAMTTTDRWGQPRVVRDQLTLFQPSLDDIISQDHEVRLLNETLRTLDWSAWEASCKLPASDPSLNLKPDTSTSPLSDRYIGANELIVASKRTDRSDLR